MPGLSPVLKVQANAKLPDALRLSGLQNSCNVLNLHNFVGRIRRSRRIRHEQSAFVDKLNAGFNPSIIFIPAKNTLQHTE
ncbi:hypothetical protein AC26_2492 [Escherichia coli 1-176-05_S3_C2]|nr:hypothetical protein AC26_2492 [Escherichia coli 1-176-05_S3_C2]